MQRISKPRFHKIFQPRGLVLDPRYQPPQTLVFPATPDLYWRWDLPASPRDIPRLIAALFEACDEHDSFYLYPRAGAWGCGDTLKRFQMTSVFSSAGCAPSADAVLYASVDEMDAVETLFSIALIFGGTVADDIFAIPSHGRLVLYADHHECIHANFGDEEMMNRFLPRIAGYEHQLKRDSQANSAPLHQYNESSKASYQETVWNYGIRFCRESHCS
jgi:hypothetical protein